MDIFTNHVLQMDIFINHVLQMDIFINHVLQMDIFINHVLQMDIFKNHFNKPCPSEEEIIHKPSTSDGHSQTMYFRWTFS